MNTGKKSWKKPESLSKACTGTTTALSAAIPLLVRGRSIEYIAQNLTISFNTAKSHIRHIYVKADVHSRQELQELLDREE